TPAPLLPHIARPTLFITSNHDMMFPKKLIQQWLWLASANENIALVQTRWGGHCCFYEGALSLQPISWAERVVEEFLTALALRPSLLFARRPSLPPSLPSSPMATHSRGEEGEEEEEEENEVWIQRSLSSTSSTASNSSWSSSTSFSRSRLASSPPLLPSLPPSLPRDENEVAGRPGEGEGEDEGKEDRKEAVKGVLSRAGLVGWALTLVVVLGLFASQPLRLPGAIR
ncbi:hypothetical protein VYU27_008210, partial [Nannochloropsis oceanica]